MTGGGIAATSLVAHRYVPTPLLTAVGAGAAGGYQVLSDYRRTGDHDDTPALIRALASGKRSIYLPAGGGSAKGEYRIWMDPAVTGAGLPSGTRLKGDGDSTVIRPTRSGHGCLFDALSSSASDYVEDLEFANFRAIGWVEYALFAEHAHLIRLNGVSNVLLENLRLEGFQGDGIYLGSHYISGMERHNRDVVIRSCLFDGTNGNNRNAISVIDCTRFQLYNSEATRVTRRGDGTPRSPQSPEERANPRFGIAMPGALDFEPDGIGDWARIQDVTVDGWAVTDCGGAGIALNLRDNNTLKLPHSGFRISNFVARNCRTGISLHGYRGDTALGAQRRYDVSVQITAYNTEFPIAIEGMLGAKVSGSATDCGTAMIGVSGNANADVTIRVDYLRCGGASSPNPGVVTRIAGSTRNLSLDGSTYEHCGDELPGQLSTMIYFTNGEHRSFSASYVTSRSIRSSFSRARFIATAGGAPVHFITPPRLIGNAAPWSARSAGDRIVS